MIETKVNREMPGSFYKENFIAVKLRLESILAKYAPDNSDHFPMPPEATLGDLLNRLNLQEDQVMLAFVNGKMANLKTRLKDRDSVSLCPYICGG